MENAGWTTFRQGTRMAGDAVGEMFLATAATGLVAGPEVGAQISIIGMVAGAADAFNRHWWRFGDTPAEPLQDYLSERLAGPPEEARRARHLLDGLGAAQGRVFTGDDFHPDPLVAKALVLRRAKSRLKADPEIGFGKRQVEKFRLTRDLKAGVVASRGGRRT